MPRTNARPAKSQLPEPCYNEPPAGADTEKARQHRALDAVIDETVALFHRLRAVAEQIHRQGKTSGGKRNLLRLLNLYGPQTVPQLAQARTVSRQHIQKIVNQLAADGDVELVDNPSHRRSRLVRLTEQGRDYLDAMHRREMRLLAGIEINISSDELLAAAAVLRHVRELFESDQWAHVIEAES